MIERPKNHSGDNGASTIPVAEWVIAVVGAAIVVGVIAGLTIIGLRGSDSAPRLSVEIDSTVAQGDRYLVSLTARNTSNAAAAHVVIRGVLNTGEAMEESEVTLDYLPGNARRSAGLLFENDPRRHPLHLRPAGYTIP